jgi:hypothetical protein
MSTKTSAKLSPRELARHPARRMAHGPAETRAAVLAGRSVRDLRVTVQKVNVPGYTATVDAAKYTAMQRALLKVLPSRLPGLTQSEMFEAVLPHLPAALFPAGAKAGWWAKTVQLDLEARGRVRRESTRPLRWLRASRG